MRVSRLASLSALFCLAAEIVAAQHYQPQAPRVPLPTARVKMTPLPPPPPGHHGHPPDSRTGNAPCPATFVSVHCATPTPATPDPHLKGSSYQAPSGVPPSSTDRQTPSTYEQPPQTQRPIGRGGGVGRPLPIGLGVGALAGISIWALSEHEAHEPRERLSRDGPQFSDSLNMSSFQVTGFAKGGWPLVVDYDAESGAYLLLTVVAQNATPAQYVLAVPPNGRVLQLLQLPNEFGSALKLATFSLTATVSATDATPRFLRIYGFGCGPRSVGSVAIDELHIAPLAVSVSQPGTQFNFHTHTTFDKMKAEFMQIALVDHSVEGQLFDNEKIKGGRIVEGSQVKQDWNATKAKPGQIQFRVRGWMTAQDGGDWVSAFSPDLVFKQ